MVIAHPILWKCHILACFNHSHPSHLECPIHQSKIMMDTIVFLLLLIVAVEVHWHNRDMMKVSPVHKEEFGIGGLAQYEVSAALCFI